MAASELRASESESKYEAGVVELRELRTANVAWNTRCNTMERQLSDLAAKLTTVQATAQSRGAELNSLRLSLSSAEAVGADASKRAAAAVARAENLDIEIAQLRKAAADAETALDPLTERLTALETENSGLRSEAGRQRESRAAAERSVAELSSELRDARTAAASRSEEISALHGKVADLAGREAASATALAAALRDVETLRLEAEVLQESMRKAEEAVVAADRAREALSAADAAAVRKTDAQVLELTHQIEALRVAAVLESDRVWGVESSLRSILEASEVRAAAAIRDRDDAVLARDAAVSAQLPSLKEARQARADLAAVDAKLKSLDESMPFM